LRRMRRFGDADSFLDLIGRIRDVRPDAGIRSNVIAGFPGESEADVEVLAGFLAAARLDAVGVFGYSDEEGTEGASLDGKVDRSAIDERVDRLGTLVDEVSADRASERVGERTQVLVEAIAPDGTRSGRSVHQGPETDGGTTLGPADNDLVTGALAWGTVTATDGVDLIVELEG
ncbi:MAG: MiaB/RimO family radical SAM methylthiotransferase, partial [Actinobacteria bacterium HGW-Actinobacteria-5]